MSAPKVLGLSIDDTTYKLLLLLASSPSRSIPALIFARPFSIIPEAEIHDLQLEKFHLLFATPSDKDKIHDKRKTTQSKTSIYDFQYGAIKVGPELEALQREMHLNITYQEKVTFLEISAQLRQQIWSSFAAEPRKHREAQMELCLLIILSLPTPYTEPLWETTSFVCKDVISTTLIPFLFKLSTPIGFYPFVVTEENYCLLIFHLTNLGFVLDDTHWHLLFGSPKSSDFESFFNVHQQMSHLLNVPSSELHIEKLKDASEFSLPQASLYVSLIGFTISRIAWKSSIPDLRECYESWRLWWSANSPFRTTSLEDIAYAIVYPREINVADLTYRLPAQLTCALAVGLRYSDHLEMSSNLLDLGLTFDNSEIYSHVYVLLLAELLKLLTLSDQAQKALIMATTYLEEAGTNHAYVSIAKADAYIALGKYNEAGELLQRIILDRSIESSVEFGLVLRLNKVWRRNSDMLTKPRFAHNLASVMDSIKRQDIQIQEEYMNELQATVYHVKHLKRPVPSDLHRLIKDTLELYKEDDTAVQKHRSALRMLLENDDAEVPMFEHAQNDRGPPETACREPSISINEVDNFKYIGQEQYADAQLQASYGRGAGLGRAFSDPFADSNIKSHSLTIPTAHSDGIITQESEKAWREKNMLSLDGTGTHIYWSLLVLRRLTNLIKQEEKEQSLSPERPWNSSVLASSPDTYERELLEGDLLPLPCNYFDVICSESMGGFVALMLGKYRLGIEKCMTLYKRMLQDTLANRMSNSMATQILSDDIVLSPWNAKEAIAIMRSLTLKEPSLRTAPGTCAVFIAASSHTKNNKKEQRPYLIRSYDIFQRTPEDHQQGSIPINPGGTGEFNTSEAMQAATAYWAAPKKTTILSTPLNAPRTIYLSGLGNGPGHHLIDLSLQELKSLHGTEDFGILVSIGVARGRQLPFQRSYPERRIEEPSTNLLSLDKFWRFSEFNDREGVDVGQTEWEPLGITTKKHMRGSVTLGKIDAAFDKWVSQPTNSTNLRKCARELVARRRIRAIDQNRWNIYVSGKSSVNPFGDEEMTDHSRSALSRAAK